MNRPKIKIGTYELEVFADSHDVVTAFRGKEIALGDKILYAGMICEVIGEFIDEAGLAFPTLLAVSRVGGTSFRVEMR